LGGRETAPRYGGSFKTLREARVRRDLIAGELAALRVPDLRRAATAAAPTVREAAARWRASRLDVSDGTRVLHRVALDRVLPILGSRRVDELEPVDVAGMVTALAAR